MLELKVEELVAGWFAGEHTMFEACTEEPEVAWSAIVELSVKDLTGEQRSLLSGGPLETLLSWHGNAFIDRVEAEADKNPKFNYLLGGVWRQNMPDEVWSRIVKIRQSTF